MIKYLSVLFLGFLTACTPKPTAQQNTANPLESSNLHSQPAKAIYPRLATLPASQEGDSSALQGVLTIKGSCIYAKAATNALYLIASMNPDVYWDNRQQSLVLSGGKLVKPGDPLLLGGSAYTGPQGQLNWTKAPDKTCELTNIWIANSIG